MDHHVLHITEMVYNIMYLVMILMYKCDEDLILLFDCETHE